MRGIKFIPGVELTCDVELPWNEEILEANFRHRPPPHHGIFLHIFQPFPIPEGLKRFEDWLSPLRGESKFLECLKIIDKVNAFGMNIEADDVLSRAQRRVLDGLISGDGDGGRGVCRIYGRGF